MEFVLGQDLFLADGTYVAENLHVNCGAQAPNSKIIGKGGRNHPYDQWVLNGDNTLSDASRTPRLGARTVLDTQLEP